MLTLFPTQPFGGLSQQAFIGTPRIMNPPRFNGRWALYDDKRILHPGLDKNCYDSKSPHLWL